MRLADMPAPMIRALGAGREKLMQRLKPRAEPEVEVANKKDKVLKRPVAFGERVRDKITLFEGIVTIKEYRLTGVVHWGVSGEGASPPLISFDEARLEVIEGRNALDCVRPMDTYTIILGEEVKDIITGYKGYVTAIIEQINGCVHLEVKGKVDLNQKASHYYKVEDHKQFEHVSPGVSAKSSTPIKTAPASIGCCRSTGFHDDRRLSSTIPARSQL